jgi:hypothetical protein
MARRPDLLDKRFGAVLQGRWMMRKQVLVSLLALAACSTSSGGLPVVDRDDGTFEIAYGGSMYATSAFDARAAGKCGRDQQAGFVREEERDGERRVRIYRCMD